MSFLHPHLLWLIAIPVLLFIWDCLRRNPSNGGDCKILTANAGPGGLTLTPSATVRRARIRWRLCLGLILVTLTVARPQWGRIEEPVFDQSREILVAIDLSRSMLADDVKPTRLERARLLTQSLLENTPSERVGLVVFAGTAFLQSPLSSDHEIIRDFLPQLNPDFLPAGGTNFKALLKTSLDAFSDSPADRFLIILSDGEAANEDWKDLAKKCADRGIHILSLGIGTSAGAMLPDGQGGLIKDQRGAVVLSKIDDSSLRQLAEQTGGVYTDASQWVDLSALINATVDQGRKGDFKETGTVRLGERYQWALAPAFFFLLWSLLSEFPVRPDGAARKWQSKDLRTKSAALLLALTVSIFIIPHPAFAADEINDGLPELVAKLADKPELSASDYADLAKSTVQYGQDFQAKGKPAPAGPLSDGLAAITAGQKLDPKAADWDKLKATLEQLLKPPAKQEPPPDDQKKPDKNKSEDSDKSDKSEDKSDKSDPGKPNDKPDQGESKEGDSDASQDKGQGKPSDQSGEQNGDSKPSDKNEGNTSPEDQSDKQPDQDQSAGQTGDPSKEHQQAFGDMNDPQETPPDQKDQQPVPAPGEPDAQAQPAKGDTQRVGGAPNGEELPTDPALLQTLQRLEQLKTQDSPARLFQLLQDPNAQSPAPAGQTW